MHERLLLQFGQTEEQFSRQHLKTYMLDTKMLCPGTSPDVNWTAESQDYKLRMQDLKDYVRDNEMFGIRLPTYNKLVDP